MSAAVVKFQPIDQIAHDELVAFFKAKLAEAESGELVGHASICLYRDNSHDTHVVGEARSRPVFTRGVLPDLHEELTALARGSKT